MRAAVLYIALLIGSLLNAQSNWVYQNSYYECKQMLETYDGGTLILANDEGFYGPTKLFKLDKTGEILWEHTFEENHQTLPLCMAEDSQGNIIIGGMTFRYQSNSADGFLVKLNPCGELLWYKAIVEDNNGIYITNVVLDSNDNIIINENNNDTNNWEYTEDTTLKKYSPDGQLLWSSVLLPDGQSSPQRVIACSDGGYLVEGDFYAPPYYNQGFNVHYLRACLVKTDSLGNVEWRNIYRWEQDTEDTIYMSSSTPNVIEIANGEFITKAPKREIPNFRPDLYKVNSQGETIWSKDISEDNRTYSNSSMVMDKDSNLILGINVAEGNYNYDDDYTEIYKFNQQGDELARWECPQQTSILRDFRWNRDSTSLFVTPGSKISSNGTWSLYAYKFNPYTMELDTFATEDDNVYDYLCPDGVVDLNFEFPDLIGLEEAEAALKVQLRIAPNPAKNYTYLYFDIEDFNRTAKLEIHSLQGQLMRSYPIQGAVGRVHEDLSLYTSGMYIVSLVLDNRVVETQQMVVE